MHTIYCIIGYLLINYSVSAEQCVSNQWPSKLGSTIPGYRVDLDASPLVRWNQIATVYKNQIKTLLNYIKSYIINEWPMFKFLLDMMYTKLPIVAETLPAPYSDELRGISQITGIPLGEIVFYNIFYEISSFCTSVVAQDQDGNIFHGRNLDFGLFLGWNKVNKTWIMTDLLRPLVISINYTKNNQVLFRTTSFAGFIGVITGIKPGVFSISLNIRFDLLNGGFMGVIEWIYNINRQQSFVTLAIRDMLTTAKTYDQAVEYLSEIPLLAPCYYILAGSEPGQGAIISRSRQQSINIKKLDNKNQWYLIQTNYDHWKEQPSFDDRLTPAIKCIQTKGRTNMSFESLSNLLSSRPMLNKLTIYTSLMQPKTGEFQSYIQFCRDEDAPCTLW